MVVTPQTRFGHSRSTTPLAPMRTMPCAAGWAVLSDVIGPHRGNRPSGAVHLPMGYYWPGRWRVGRGAILVCTGRPRKACKHRMQHGMKCACIVRACARCDMGSRVARG